MRNKLLKTLSLATLAFFVSVNVNFAGPDEDLQAACMQGNFNAAKAAIEAGADVNKTDASGNTPICNAYFWPEITKMLIDNGADVNAGMMPALVSASSCYSLDVVKMLLEAGADVNKPGKIDTGAMFKKLLADEKAKKKKANKYLIKAYEDQIKNATTSNVSAAQQCIVGSNCAPILQLLLDNGANLTLDDGKTLFQIWAAQGQTEGERKEAWAQAAAGYAQFGVTVPDWATSLSDDLNRPYAEMLTVLLDKDPEIMTKGAPNPLGVTELYDVLKRAQFTKYKGQCTEAVKIMCEKGVDVNEKSERTDVPWIYHHICMAVETGDMEILKAIVEAGADLNVTVSTSVISYTLFEDNVGGEPGKGYTALSIAIMKGEEEMVNYLVNKGADLTIGAQGFSSIETSTVKCLVTVKNKTPIYWAIERGNPKMIEFLATKLTDVKLPEFTARVWADMDNKDNKYTCKKLKKVAYSPSEWAMHVENEEAAKILADKGL